MKKSSLVLGLILTQLLAPHSQASEWRGNSSGLVETNASPLGVAGAHDALCPAREAGLWSEPAVYKDVRVPDNEGNKFWVSDGNSRYLVPLFRRLAATSKQKSPAPAHLRGLEKLLQNLHPGARHALGCALFDAKPEEALRISIAYNVGERHRESVVHHVKFLDHQTLVDILNMMCILASNRDAVIGRTSSYGTLKKPFLDWQDPFVEGSVFISRAPMKSITMKKPCDEDTQ